MKKLMMILVIALMGFTTANAQTLLLGTDGYYYATGIIKVDSMKQEVIHSIAQEWVALFYKSTKDVTQLDNNSKIIVKGCFSWIYAFNGTDVYINHTLILEFKDNAVRYTINFSTYEGVGFSYKLGKGGFAKRSITESEKSVNDVVYSLTDKLKNYKISTF